MKKILISFSTPQFRQKQINLNNSAIDKGFTQILSYDENSLDDSFIKDFGNILDHPRGFGYWSWKSFIIKKTFDMCDDGDIICYLDSGNIIIENLDVILNGEHGDVVLFENRDANPNNEVWINRQWTKRDCFTMLDCDDEKYWNGKQVNATYQVYKKSKFSSEFVLEFYNASRNMDIISDNPNKTLANLPEFCDHRHDQSILSILAIKHDIKLLPDPSGAGNLDPNRTFPQLFHHCR